METTDMEFRQHAALEVMCRMLEHPDVLTSDFVHWSEEHPDKSIHVFVADTAVQYADALIASLEV